MRQQLVIFDPFELETGFLLQSTDYAAYDGLCGKYGKSIIMQKTPGLPNYIIPMVLT